MPKRSSSSSSRTLPRRDLPVKTAALSLRREAGKPNVPESLGTCRGCHVDVVSASDPGRQPRRGIGSILVKRKPARSPRRRGGVVDRDHLQVHRVAQSQQCVVGAHSRMLAPGLQPHPQGRFNPSDTDLERRGGYSDVVQLASLHHKRQPASYRVVSSPSEAKHAS